MSISDGICAYVAGGLGNQLFILAAAWEQSNRLQCPLYLDTSFHSVAGVRPFELDGLKSPGLVLNHSPWRSVRLSKDRVIPVPRLTRPVRRSVFLERDSSRYDASINAIRPGTTLFGYFQSPLYFESIRNEMRTLILEAPETPAESELLQKVASDKRVTVHLRRGDYLKPGLGEQLIASNGYALRARSLLRKLGETHSLRVFSDSPDLVKEELRDAGGDIEFFDDGGVLTPINTIKAMSSGEAFVMSNSSFSWWGAWLMQETRGPETIVISPRPWNETGTAKADLLKSDWISLDSR